MSPSYEETTPARCVRSMKKNGKLAVALLCMLFGAALLLFGNRFTRKDESGTGSPAPPTPAQTAEEYRASLEARMEAICAQVAGVGEVDVAVMLNGGFSYVYATDKKTTVGGESHTYVTVRGGDGEELVYLSESAPDIVGIGVVCTGGMDPTPKAAERRAVTSLRTVGSMPPVHTTPMPTISGALSER